MSKLIVGVGDMKVSKNPEDQIITYALGSCIGVVIYDPIAKVGGMLHAMLPDSSIHKDKKKEDFNPDKFVNTGIPSLFKAAYKLGAEKKRIIVRLAGCSQVMDESGIFNIGKRNYAATKKMLWKNSVIIKSEHCAKSDSVTVILNINTGETIKKIANKQYPL